eukprot:gnl/MRDRNA2_/MRDRNA2_83873_c0_seq1.p1 gnl/MRDRNA2_/MRDRNA2_83873_c0~~gnl/MRDRNA2_/MRDRNA2_83873_c0_seq1.p1  ORF type:complete len:368 (-),score=74.81 gnl/MRDRNA2_/MRDRNA2_83873_c0_seq1:404-1507(-)
MNRVRILSQQVQPASVAAAEGAYLEPQQPPAPQPNDPAVSKGVTNPALNVVSATRGSEQVAAAALDKGYVIVEDLIDAATLDALNKEFQEAGFLWSGVKESFGGYDTFRNAVVILGMSKTLQKLAVHPVIVNTAKEILLPYCKRIKLGTCSRICKFPNRTIDAKPVPPQPLHRDDQMFAASDWPHSPGFKPQFVISVMWACTDFTKENGATNIVPGSHKWQPDDKGKRPILQREEVLGGGHKVSDEDMQVISAEMKAGSAVIWLGSTLHGAGQHDGAEKSGTRDGLAFFYNLGWLNNEHNWHFAIPLDVQKGFAEELRDLLGHREDGTNTDHPWITGPIYTLPYQGDSDHGLDAFASAKADRKSQSN